MTNYFTHVPCESMLLNGLDLNTARNYLYSLDDFETYGPMNYAIFFTKLVFDDVNGHIPEIHNRLVDISEYIKGTIEFKIINKNTGEEVEIKQDGTTFKSIEFKRSGNGIREFKPLLTPDEPVVTP